jgi:threonine/homoserine/homoserine lactone efflux protein
MSWSKYAEFLVFATLLVLVPGPDFAVVTKNALAGGRRRGSWTAAGVATSNLLQGTAAVCGLSAVIVRAQPVFETIKWAGVAYLALLGAQAIRSAIRGRYELTGDYQSAVVARPLAGWRQGFLSNITNPKVLIFYLAVMPQFLVPGASPGWLLAFAWSHAALSLGWLLALTAGLHQIRGLLARRAVHRGLDITTGAALLGFSARLAADQA